MYAAFEGVMANICIKILLGNLLCRGRTKNEHFINLLHLNRATNGAEMY